MGSFEDIVAVMRNQTPRFRPVLLQLASLILLALCCPEAGEAQRTQGTPRGTAENAARELFGRYVALHRACDPAVLDLFAVDAGITWAEIHPTTGRVRLAEIPLHQYSRALRQRLAQDKAAGRCGVFSTPTFALMNDGSVWVETSQTVGSGRFQLPLRLRVGPHGRRAWRILEERAGQRPRDSTPEEQIAAWGAEGTPEAIERLEAFWLGPDDRLRDLAAEALVRATERILQQGAEEEAARLGLDLYLFANQAEVRRRAFVVYVRAAGDTAVPHLEAILLKRRDPELRLVALDLLRELSGPRAQALQRQLGVTPDRGSSQDGQIVDWVPYRLPPFAALQDELRQGVEQESSAQEYENLRRDPQFKLRKVRYYSEGLEVVAYVYGPARRPENSLPVILFNRGGYQMEDAAPLLLSTFHRLATAGFLVVAPQYRGSDGAAGRDAMGGEDVADVFHAAKLARNLPEANPRNLFIYGISRGGMMAFQVIRDGLQARAVATVGAFTDLAATIEENPAVEQLAHQIWPDFDRRRESISRRRSALLWADRLEVPLLLLHGGEDEVVSPNQTLRLGLALEALGFSYQLAILKGGNHTLREQPALRDQRVIDWFRRHRARR